MKKIPTTIQKFARDLVIAVAAYALLWIEQNLGVLELGPETSGVAVAVLLLGHRALRDKRSGA